MNILIINSSLFFCTAIGDWLIDAILSNPLLDPLFHPLVNHSLLFTWKLVSGGNFLAVSIL